MPLFSSERSTYRSSVRFVGAGPGDAVEQGLCERYLVATTGTLISGWRLGITI